MGSKSFDSNCLFNFLISKVFKTCNYYHVYCLVDTKLIVVDSALVMNKKVALYSDPNHGVMS